METSAAEPLISMRVFTVANCSTCLVSKESPFSEVASLVILKSATVSHPTLLSLSPYSSAHSHTHKQGLQNPLFPILWKD